MSKLNNWTGARKIETIAGMLTLIAIIIFIAVPVLTLAAKIATTEIKWIWSLW